LTSKFLPRCSLAPTGYSSESNYFRVHGRQVIGERPRRFIAA
jgi:hypothetical protein